MNKEAIYIFGTSNFSWQMLCYLSSHEDILVKGFVVDEEYYSQKVFHNLPVITTQDYLNKFTSCKLLFALGYRDMEARKLKFEQLRAGGVCFFSYVHPSSQILTKSENLGEGIIIFPSVTIEPNSVIGDAVIIWSNAVICHDIVIQDNCFIAANTTIGGHVEIGTGCFLGFAAVIKNNVNVPDKTLVGANSFVHQSLPESGVYVGSPARLKKKILEGVKIED